MPFNKPSQRKTGAAVLLFVFGFWVTFAALFGAPRPVQAFPTEDIINEAQSTLVNVWNKVTDAMVEGVSVALANAANYFLSQMAYQIAVGIVSGCPGQKPCFSTGALKDMVSGAAKGALGEAIGSLSQAGGFEALGLNLCKPPSANFGLSIQLGLLDEAKPPKPKCDFNEVMKNWETAAKSLSPSELKKNLWQGFKPGASPLSVGLHASSSIQMTVLDEQSKKFSEQMSKMSGAGGFVDVTDQVTKAVRTPAASVKAEFERGEREKYEYPKLFNQIQQAGQSARGSVFGSILMNAAMTFGQTLLAQLWNKLVNKLLGSQTTPEAEPAPELLVSEEGISVKGETEMAAALAPSYTMPPLAVAGVIDPLAQFSVCPDVNRTQNNCVVDTQFAAAVRLANSISMTVGEAVKQNYLHGDWKLVPSTDNILSYDPHCSAQAYCEANLKKLRAARILPIGWEIVASLGTSTHYYTLQEALNGFDKSGPLYHLIDPGWVLKQPLTQCKAQVFGQALLTPEIARRTETCVDQPTCLRENDFGACIGEYGYCTKERNVWRFNGDSCPEQFNTCRVLQPRSGNRISLISNTIDRGTCNASNVGCRAYASKLNAFSCTLTATDLGASSTGDCTLDNGCACTNTATCDVPNGKQKCVNVRGEICTLPQSSCTGASCPCSVSYKCRVPRGLRTCTTVQGAVGDTSDDWLATPAKYFNKTVDLCSVDKNGCSAVNKLGADQSLNLVRNGGFENLEDADGDGEPDRAKYWSPFGSLPSSSPGAVISDPAKVIEGGHSLRVGSDATGVYTAPVQDTCTNTSCASEQGCACVKNGRKCIVYKGHDTCTISDRLIQDGIPVSGYKTYTLSATFKKENTGSAAAAEMRLRFMSGDGKEYIGLPAGTLAVSAGDATTTTCEWMTNGNLRLYSAVFAADTNLARPSCTFMISYPVSAAFLMLTGTNALVDRVMLTEGSSTDFHEGYGGAETTEYLKVAPGYLGCRGEDTDLPECASFSSVCRENEVGCDLYSPVSGDPSIPGITSPKDSCPAECVGYDVFKQGATDFERQEKFPLYFIPSTARACTAQENGCSEFTDILTEKVAYYSKIRLCQLPDAGDNQVFYSWEGSDTAGYQLKVWNLKRTLTAAADSSTNANAFLQSDIPVAVGTSPGTAPCTRLNTSLALNSFGQPTCVDVPADREGLCSRADIDAGNFDCRELYDEFGNKHYRLLPKTILGTADCRRYRITVSTPTDCVDSNGKWDDAKKECVYLASLVDSTACAGQANGCRAYKGNTAATVRNLITDDFENGKGAWDVRLSDYNPTGGSGVISSESVSVGGHSLKIEAANPTAFRDVTSYVGPNRAYTLSFWARGSGKLAINFVNYAGSGDLRCDVTACSGNSCSVCTHALTGLSCNFSPKLTEGTSSYCWIPRRSTMTPAAPAYTPFSDLTGGSRCSNDLTRSCNTDTECVGAGRCGTRIQTVELSSEWKQFQVGPVIISDIYFGRAPVGIKIDSYGPTGGAATSDVFMDKFVLKQANDNIYVVRDSWKTPLVCDQTADGQISPLEMLGCRQYSMKDGSKVTLRSFTKLCREKSVGCSAYSLMQNTPNNPYEETFNAVCALGPGMQGYDAASGTCRPTGGQANCLCEYLTPHWAAFDRNAGAATPVIHDACRVNIGNAECRFHLDGRDNFANRSVYPDILVVPADERLYLVPTQATSCSAADAGCKTFGLPDTIYEGDCAFGNALQCKNGLAVCSSGANIFSACSSNSDCGGATCAFAASCVGGTRNGLICTASGSNDCPGGSCGGGFKTCVGGTNDGMACRIAGDCGGGACVLGLRDPAKNTCACTDARTGSKCNIEAGQVSCKFSPERGMTKDWKATAIKDDPSKYDQTLCREEDVGCEEYTSAEGAWYFKDPGNKACVYKENATIEGRQRSGWFRQTAGGAMFACYPELVKNGNYFEIYRNRDQTCSLASKCTDPAGCLCPSASSVTCKVLYGNTQCGFTGWVGMCDPKYDFCNEFIDPLGTSPSNKTGQPYYYIMNSKLDKSSCNGTVSLKQGCVLFNQTSNPAKTFSAAATYIKSIKETPQGRDPLAGDSVGAENCGSASRSSKWCDKRCASIRNGYCHKTCTNNCDYEGEANECWQNDTSSAGCPAGGTCVGDMRYTTGCVVSGDCNPALKEQCVGESTPSARTFTGNDTNIILKVRRDRECGQWLSCASASTTWDDGSKKWISTCTDFAACEKTGQLGSASECVQYVEPPKQILTASRYSSRDVTWTGLDYSGFSLFGRYPIQYLQPVKPDPAYGICVSTGKSVEDGSLCKADGSDGKCVGGFCTRNIFAIQRFGVKINYNVCDSAQNSAITGANTACPTDGVGNGTCYNNGCYYALTGGPVNFADVRNAASCRAYPEADAPFGASVVEGGAASSDGYDSATKQAKNKITAFRGANVCTKDNYCECAYQRVAYGQNQFVRYYGLNPITEMKSGVNVPLGVCSGGTADGYPCGTGTSEDCKHGTAEDPNGNGQCLKQTGRNIARGWPGFCVDMDPTQAVNNDARQGACIIWLPVDQLGGMPSQYNQYVEAGFEIQKDLNLQRLQYCTAEDGGATTLGGGYNVKVFDDHSCSGFPYCKTSCQDGNDNIWEQGDSGYCDHDQPGIQKVKLRYLNLKRPELLAIKMKFWRSRHNDLSYFYLNDAKGWERGFKFRTDESNSTWPPPDNIDDTLNTTDHNGWWGDPHPSCSDEYNNVTQVLWCDHACDSILDYDAGLAAYAEFDADGYLDHIDTRYCNNDNSDNTGHGEIEVIVRQMCTEITDVAEPGQPLYVNITKLQNMADGTGPRGVNYAPQITLNGTNQVLMPYGHVYPLTAPQPPDTMTSITYPGDNPHESSLPVWNGWGPYSSPYNWAVDSNPDNWTGGATAAGYVFTKSQLQAYFVKAYGFYTLTGNYASYSRSGDGWDLRATQTGSNKTPTVVGVDTQHCVDNVGTQLCR